VSTRSATKPRHEVEVLVARNHIKSFQSRAHQSKTSFSEIACHAASVSRTRGRLLHPQSDLQNRRSRMKIMRSAGVSRNRTSRGRIISPMYDRWQLVPWAALNTLPRSRSPGRAPIPHWCRDHRQSSERTRSRSAILESTSRTAAGDARPMMPPTRATESCCEFLLERFNDHVLHRAALKPASVLVRRRSDAGISRVSSGTPRYHIYGLSPGCPARDGVITSTPCGSTNQPPAPRSPGRA